MVQSNCIDFFSFCEQNLKNPLLQWSSMNIDESFVKNIKQIEKDKILMLAENGQVTRSLAEKLIKRSAYWYSHRSGHPVNAPNHAQNIESQRSNDWKIEFGANTFCISHAVLGCQSVLMRFLELEKSTIDDVAMQKLKNDLANKIRNSVENNTGNKYKLYPVNGDNHMEFGSQSICINNFITCLLKECQTFSRKSIPICQHCLQIFSNKLTLKQHQNIKHSEKYYGR